LTSDWVFSSVKRSDMIKQVLIRANPSKGGDAKLRTYGSWGRAMVAGLPVEHNITYRETRRQSGFCCF